MKKLSQLSNLEHGLRFVMGRLPYIESVHEEIWSQEDVERYFEVYSIEQAQTALKCSIWATENIEYNFSEIPGSNGLSNQDLIVYFQKANEFMVKVNANINTYNG